MGTVWEEKGVVGSGKGTGEDRGESDQNTFYIYIYM